MKKMFSIVAGIALAAVAVSANAERRSPPPKPQLVDIVNVNFDGYCDGMFIRLYDNGIVEGSRTGCGSEGVAGWEGYNSVEGQDTISVLVPGFGDLRFVIKSDGSWAWYTNGGAVGNSGFWSEGYPAEMSPRAGALPSSME